MNYETHLQVHAHLGFTGVAIYPLVASKFGSRLQNSQVGQRIASLHYHCYRIPIKQSSLLSVAANM